MFSTKQLSHCLALILLLTLDFWLPCRAQAVTVKLPKRLAETMAFVGSVAKKFGVELGDSNAPNMDKVVLELNDYRKRHPNASAAELDNYYRVLKTDHVSLQKVTWHEDLLLWGVSKAERLGEFGRNVAKWAKRVDNLTDKSNQIEQGRREYGEEAAKTQARTALEEMVRDAKTTSRPGHPSPLAGVVNQIARDTTGKDIRHDSTLTDIANKDPDFARSEVGRYMQANQEADGSVRLSLEELKTQFGVLQGNINAQMTEMRGVLGEIASQQRAILDWVRDQHEQRLRAEQAQRFQQTLEQIDQAVTGYSALLKFINPELGHKVEVVSKSAIQFASGMKGLIDAVSKDGSGLFSFASAAATGNMIGAAMQIFSLFNSGPNTDQLILEGIQQLKEQIESLRQEMHQRFDIIDRKLDDIMEEMVTRFNRIDFQLGVLNDNVEDIQISLVGLQADLNRIEQNLFAFLDDGFRQDLRLAITGWLGYHERTGMDMTYQEYSNAATGPENQFHTWATLFSRDQLRAGPNSRDYSDSGVLPELTNYPLHFNINYLSQFPAQRFGLPALAAGRLPNLRDWAHSADAYRILAEENRKYDQLINPARLDAIYNTGTALQAALRNITVKASSANYDLFNALHANYTNKLPAVQLAIQEIENTYYKNPDYKLMLNDNPNNYPANKALDIFWGADQSINYSPGISNISYTAGTGAALSVGSVLSRFNIPEPFVIADYMTSRQMPNANIGRLSLRVVAVSLLTRFQTDVNWRSYTEVGGDSYLGTGTGQYRYFKDEIRYVRPKISIGLMWEGSAIRVRSVMSAEIEAHHHRYYTNNNSVSTPQFDRRLSTEQVEANTAAWVRANWDSVLRPLFQSSSIEETPTDSELLQRNSLQLLVGAQVDRRLQEHQIALYTDILAALDSATTLRNNARILTGAKELWSAYVVLGISRTLERDEQLRGLLFGNQSLLDTRDDPDESLLHGFYNDAIVLLNAGLRVPKVEVYSFEEGHKAVGQQRADALHSLLTGYLDKIRDHELTESLELVEVTLLQLDLFRKTRYNPTIAEVTPSISITREVPRFNRSAASYTQRILLRNTSNVALAGPITLVFDRVGSNPTPRLALPDGQTLFFSLSTNNHSPYVYVGAGEDNLLSPGETAMITVELLPSVRAKLPPYNNRVLAGDGEQ